MTEVDIYLQNFNGNGSGKFTVQGHIYKQFTHQGPFWKKLQGGSVSNLMPPDALASPGMPPVGEAIPQSRQEQERDAPRSSSPARSRSEMLHVG